ncbi:hypothetical protein [Flavobacterium album]|uniref:hypothetical protein n=1 Tax=Flavobacterium album TaxID=2175091 RepID=UPI0011B21F3F|nr:hypothetical protein [Flavobacterium album]
MKAVDTFHLQNISLFQIFLKSSRAGGAKNNRGALNSNVARPEAYHAALNRIKAARLPTVLRHPQKIQYSTTSIAPTKNTIEDRRLYCATKKATI